MQVTLSTENKIILEAFKKEAVEIKQEVIELSIHFIIQLKTFLFQFLLSYKEFSLTNIRSHGLTEILMNRALRFFKLDGGEEPLKKSKQKTKSKWNWGKMIPQKSVASQKTNKETKNNGANKYLFKKSIKVILFPFYLLILMFRMLLESKSKRKSKKYVRNVYKE